MSPTSSSNSRSRKRLKKARNTSTSSRTFALLGRIKASLYCKRIWRLGSLSIGRTRSDYERLTGSSSKTRRCLSMKQAIGGLITGWSPILALKQGRASRSHSKTRSQVQCSSWIRRRVYSGNGSRIISTLRTRSQSRLTGTLKSTTLIREWCSLALGRTKTGYVSAMGTLLTENRTLSDTKDSKVFKKWPSFRMTWSSQKCSTLTQTDLVIKYRAKLRNTQLSSISMGICAQCHLKLRMLVKYWHVHRRMEARSSLQRKVAM